MSENTHEAIEKKPSPHTARVQFYTNAYKGVLKKLEKAVRNDGKDFSIPPNLQATIEKTIHEKITHGYWTHARDLAVQESHLDPAQSDKIDAIAQESLEDYIRHFYIRSTLFPTPASTGVLRARQWVLANQEDLPPANFYDTNRFRRPMVELLISHAMNITEAKFRELGLNLKSAHALECNLMGNALAIYEAIDNDNAYINPRLGRMANSTSSEIAERSGRLRNYRDNLRETLRKNYKEYNETQR